MICLVRPGVFQRRDELAYYLTEHLRMNGIYWGLTALCLMGHQDALNRQEMIDWVMSCWDDEIGRMVDLARPLTTIRRLTRLWHCIGAFAPHPGHDPHLHPTLSAIQILLMQDAMHLLDADKIVKCKDTLCPWPNTESILSISC